MGYLLGSLPFSCGVSTHEQTMLFMSMGNLQSAARTTASCSSVKVERMQYADLLLELLYCKISVWGTCPVPFRKSETAACHREKKWECFKQFFKEVKRNVYEFLFRGEKAVKEISIAYFSNPTEIALTSV